jgi:hypothetical protein
LREHWRPIAVLVALVAAFAVGRYTTPGPDVVIAQSIRSSSARSRSSVEKAKDRIVYRNVDREARRHEDRPLGRALRDRDESGQERPTSDRDSASDSKQTVTAYKPQWRVGALLGANVGGIHFDRPIGWDLLAAGAFAERRLVGPFFVGILGLSTGPSFGLTLERGVLMPATREKKGGNSETTVRTGWPEPSPIRKAACPRSAPKAMYQTSSTARTRNGPRILFLDIETAPLQSYHWGLWDQNIGLEQIGTEWSILSFSAKWLGERRVIRSTRAARRATQGARRSRAARGPLERCSTRPTSSSRRTASAST